MRGKLFASFLKFSCGFNRHKMIKSDPECFYYINQQNLPSICYQKKKTKRMVVNIQNGLLTALCEL